MKLAGMIVPSVDNSFFSALASCVERTLRASGVHTVICSSDNDAETEKEAFRQLTGLGVDGILCVSGLREFPEDLTDEKLPLVWVDRVPASKRPIPWVANDDSAAMEEATEFLISKGCRNILLMPGFLAQGQESPRTAGYRGALVRHGLPFLPQNVLNRKGERSSEAESEEMVRELLRSGKQIDGIITASDRAAFGAMAGLRSVGLYVPEDVKLISFDNSPYSTMATPSVTALDRNPGVLAERACDLLLRLFAGETVPLENVVPVGLVRRDSTR